MLVSRQNPAVSLPGHFNLMRKIIVSDKEEEGACQPLHIYFTSWWGVRGGVRGKGMMVNGHGLA
jgi:hypothetical protein